MSEEPQVQEQTSQEEEALFHEEKPFRRRAMIRCDFGEGDDLLQLWIAEMGLEEASILINHIKIVSERYFKGPKPVQKTVMVDGEEQVIAEEPVDSSNRIDHLLGVAMESIDNVKTIIKESVFEDRQKKNKISDDNLLSLSIGEVAIAK